MHPKHLDFHKITKNMRANTGPGLFLQIFLLFTLASCDQNISQLEASDNNHNQSDLLEKVYEGLGGRPALENLNTLYIKDSRDRYLMGQGLALACFVASPQKRKFHTI